MRLTALQVRDLAIVRGGRLLFEGLDFSLAAGEAATLVGVNGGGKSSVLRAVAGLLRPAAGAIVFADGEVALEVDAAREAAMHWLGHHDGLKPGGLAGAQLAFWARWMGGGAEDFARAVEAFDLGDLMPLEVRHLSAGQRRRLALARLVAAPRPLWLLDEPLAPLDAAQRGAFGAVAARHLAAGGLILAAVHDPLPVPARAIAVGASVAA